MLLRGKKYCFEMIFLGLVLSFSGCAHNRVTLGFSPISGKGMETPPSETVVVSTLQDHRFRLYSFEANDMPDIVGWGQATGTLYTPQNIPAHVSRSLVVQYKALGMHARYEPGLECRVEKDGSGRERVILKGANPGSGTVLCGSIIDYQFQIDHPMVGFGTYISTYNMAAGATVKAQVTLHLYLADASDGHILWKGIVDEAQGMRDAHPPDLNAKGVSLLEKTLARTIVKSAKAFSPSLE
jgi:hypothetical protein|uniref:Lipoprotein n=1 Tax=Leptospirillum ferriphilum TaxID=178606 RepID=A0A7C3LRZ0_9BACT